MDEGGCFVRWAILPGNARETWAQELVADFTNVLGDRGFRWVEVDEPGAELDRDAVQRVGAFLWAPPLGEQASLVPGGLVNLIVLAHNLVRSRVLLKIAGVEL